MHRPARTGHSRVVPSGKVTIDPPTHHCVLDVHIAEVADKKLKVLEDFAQQKPADTAADDGNLAFHVDAEFFQRFIVGRQTVVHVH